MQKISLYINVILLFTFSLITSQTNLKTHNFQQLEILIIFLQDLFIMMAMLLFTAILTTMGYWIFCKIQGLLDSWGDLTKLLAEQTSVICMMSILIIAAIESHSI